MKSTVWQLHTEPRISSAEAMPWNCDGMQPGRATCNHATQGSKAALEEPDANSSVMPTLVVGHVRRTCLSSLPARHRRCSWKRGWGPNCSPCSLQSRQMPSGIIIILIECTFRQAVVALYRFCTRDSEQYCCKTVRCLCLSALTATRSVSQGHYLAPRGIFVGETLRETRRNEFLQRRFVLSEKG